MGAIPLNKLEQKRVFGYVHSHLVDAHPDDNPLKPSTTNYGPDDYTGKLPHPYMSNTMGGRPALIVTNGYIVVYGTIATQQTSNFNWNYYPESILERQSVYGKFTPVKISFFK